MKTQMDRLLQASLAPLAHYNEKQLLKSGQLGKCANLILRRRRRTNYLHMGIFLFTIFTPVVLQLIALVVSPSSSPSNAQFSMFTLVALMQLPTLIELRLSQTRLETLVGMWLLTDHDDSKIESSDAADALAEVVFGSAYAASKSLT